MRRQFHPPVIFYVPLTSGSPPLFDPKPHRSTSLLMNSMRLHSHVPTHASILGMLSFHVQKFI